MDERINERLFDLLIHHMSLLYQNKLNTMQMYNLTHLCFLLLEIVKNSDTSVIVKIVLERLIYSFNELLYNYEIVQYFLTFYGLPRKILQRKGLEISNDFKRSNLLIDMFRLRVLLGAVNGNSDDVYFFERGHNGLIRGIKNLAQYSPDSLNIISAYYALLNYAQTLVEVKKIDLTIKGINIDKIGEDLVELIIIYKKFLNEKFPENYQLQCFDMYVSELMNKYFGAKFSIDYQKFVEIVKDQTYKNKLWIYHNLLNANIDISEYFIEDIDFLEAQKFNSYRDQITYLLSYFRANPNLKFSINIEPFDITIESSNRNWFKLENYFSNYKKVHLIDIDDSDIKKVESMDDGVLRKKISEIIINIDPNVVKRESTKSHGPFEISDMELPIFFEKKRLYLCLPFKSGVEIKDKVEAKHLYQIMRPFVHLGDKAIVVFISAREGTEVFRNEIKKMNTMSLFKVETIMGDTLVKLLKANGVI